MRGREGGGRRRAWSLAARGALEAGHQLGVDGAVDDAAELALLAGLVLEVVPPVPALAEQRDRRPDRPVGPAQPPGLPGVAALVRQHLRRAGEWRTARVGTAQAVAEPA